MCLFCRLQICKRRALRTMTSQRVELAFSTIMGVPYGCLVIAYFSTALFFHVQAKRDPAWQPRDGKGNALSGAAWSNAWRKWSTNVLFVLPIFIAVVVWLTNLPTVAVHLWPSDWPSAAKAAVLMIVLDDGCFGQPTDFSTPPPSFSRHFTLTTIVITTLWTRSILYSSSRFLASYACELWLCPFLVHLDLLDLTTVSIYTFVGVAGAVMIHAGIPLKMLGFDLTWFHRYHHAHGKDHYGVWGITDLLMGTT